MAMLGPAVSVPAYAYIGTRAHFAQISVWRYNGSAMSDFSNKMVTNCGGYIYSHGRTAVWVNDQYKLTGTKRTVNLSN